MMGFSFLPTTMTPREEAVEEEDGALRRRSTRDDGRGTDRGRGHFVFFVSADDADDDDGDNNKLLRSTTTLPE